MGNLLLVVSQDGATERMRRRACTGMGSLAAGSGDARRTSAATREQQSSCDAT
jgi:hypothetical protein